MKRHASTAAALAIAVACLACSPQAPDGGDASIVTTVKEGISGGQRIPVAAVWIHVTGSSAKGKVLDQWYRAVRSGGQYVAAVSKIPVGSYLAHGRAYASATAVPTDVPDFESVGDVGFVVTSKHTTPVCLTLQQNTARWPPDTVANAAPVVDGLVASTSTVDSSASATPISLEASASDADGPGDIAGYAWSATSAPPLANGEQPGTFSAPAALRTTWIPPGGYEGTVTITFTVTDRKLARSSVSLALAVSKAFGKGSAVIVAEFNHSPDVLSLTTADGQLEPGDRTCFTVAAVDPDGDGLRYAWDDGACNGTFGTPDQATTSYQAGATERACPVTVTVTDVRSTAPFDARGAMNRSTLIVHVLRLTPRHAPEFVFAAWSGAPDLPVAPGTSMFFSVDAIQLEGTPLAPVPVTDYAWDDGLGGAFTPLPGGELRAVTWTAPPCGGRTSPFDVDVTVTATGSAASGGLTTPLVFRIGVACP